MPNPNAAPPEPSDPTAATPVQRLQARRYNERLKFIAAAFDRLSTVVLGGAVLAPIFQHSAVRSAETVVWVIAALLLHGMGHSLLRILKEEA